MKMEWHEKLKPFLERISNFKDDELYNADVTDDIISSAQMQIVNLHKNQLSVEKGERFIRFMDSDIPRGLIIPLHGKLFEYVLYKVPFDGNIEVANGLLKDLGSPTHQSISDRRLEIVIYYKDKIHENPAVEQRIKLIAQASIDRFDRACIDYNKEAQAYNQILTSTIKSKIEFERRERKKKNDY